MVLNKTGQIIIYSKLGSIYFTSLNCFLNTNGVGFLQNKIKDAHSFSIAALKFQRYKTEKNSCPQMESHFGCWSYSLFSANEHILQLRTTHSRFKKHYLTTKCTAKSENNKMRKHGDLLRQKFGDEHICPRELVPGPSHVSSRYLIGQNRVPS
jgi:hypothetical protein